MCCERGVVPYRDVHLRSLAQVAKENYHTPDCLSRERPQFNSCAALQKIFSLIKLLTMKSRVKTFNAAPFDLTKVFDSVQSMHLTDSPREKLVVILGATSTGKSSLALTLAEKFDTEIISADSMAVYKSFNVGTAKPPQAELERVPHHLINILDAEEKFSVGEFVRRARPIITELNLRGKIPIVAGGTGLYIQALVEGYELQTVMRNGKADNEKISAENAQCAMNELAELKSSSSYYKRTGELFYNALVFGLTSDRPELYVRINRRTEKMFADGLIEEVKNLLADGVSPTAQAMLGIGYKETVEYLQGDATLDETILKVAQATRNFAKRQLTWYRRMNYIKWLKI